MAGADMDLHNIQTIIRPTTRQSIPPPRPGAALIAGGTWIFSEPQPGTHTLIDLTTLAWPALEPMPDGLRIAATCTIAQLEAFEPPPAWRAAPLITGCCNALLGSFKIWNRATVGGNVCLALPAAPMLALTVALDGTALVWTATGERTVPMAQFATGAQQTTLQPGDILRAIDLPAAALRRRTALRQASLSSLGRSAALLVGTWDDRSFGLTITASTTHPLHTAWPGRPSPATLDAHIDGIPPAAWYDDVHGIPSWRRHMTRRLAHELLAEAA